VDSLISAAARALAAGDALGALKRVALRDDPPALALRGIAMAQLGEHERARELLRRAARRFGAYEAVARARCVVAEAEVALAMRDLGGSHRPLQAAAITLATHGDTANAAQAGLITARRLLLLGKLGEAAAVLARLDAGKLPSPLTAVAELAGAELAMRSLHIVAARAALGRAYQAALHARVPALLAEVTEALTTLDQPAARRVGRSVEQHLRLDDVAALLASDALVLDACRRGLGSGEVWLPLARRPVLFALARALAASWPGDVDREALIQQVFRTGYVDESHRARLRVELGRLRALIKPLALIEATPRGYALRTAGDRAVVVLEPPIDGDKASLLALLSDGAAWSTSALALALDESQRSVQRALAELQVAAQVRTIGRARAQRWLAPPLAGFTTILLLPAALPSCIE
jgi:tetratricopeptide (TPR) repeat protein